MYQRNCWNKVLRWEEVGYLCSLFVTIWAMCRQHAASPWFVLLTDFALCSTSSRKLGSVLAQTSSNKFILSFFLKLQLETSVSCSANKMRKWRCSLFQNTHNLSSVWFAYVLLRVVTCFQGENLLIFFTEWQQFCYTFSAENHDNRFPILRLK